MTDLLNGLGAALAFSAIGIVVLIAGFVAVDLATPGNLRRQIWQDRNRNLVIVLCAGLLANATTVVVAIVTSADALGQGLIDAAAYSLLGMILNGIVFKLVDVLTPGDLGRMLADDEPHPAVWVTAVTHLAVGAVIAASIS